MQEDVLTSMEVTVSLLVLLQQRVKGQSVAIASVPLPPPAPIQRRGREAEKSFYLSIHPRPDISHLCKD